MYELRALVNVWTSPAPGSGGVPVKPSYSWDPPAVLVRLMWQDGTALWVPGHANRWNPSFVLVYVTPDEGDRSSESGLWVHKSDVTRALPAAPSTAPREPESRSVRDERELHERYPYGITSLHARRRER
jgi:hypothetical protein